MQRLMLDEATELSSILTSLTNNKIHYEKQGIFYINDTDCHLDPDINKYSHERKECWESVLNKLA